MIKSVLGGSNREHCHLFVVYMDGKQIQNQWCSEMRWQSPHSFYFYLFFYESDVN